jgi:hypothetical protein
LSLAANALHTEQKSNTPLGGNCWASAQALTQLSLDWSTNLFGKVNPPGKAVRSAILEFSASVGRQARPAMPTRSRTARALLRMSLSLRC